MSQKQIVLNVRDLMLALVGLLAVAALALSFAGRQAAAGAVAEAGDDAQSLLPPGQGPGAAIDSSVDPAAGDAAVWVTCTPNIVAIYEGRLHVRCNESYGGVNYFALPTENAASAARFLSVLTTAQVAGRTLQLLYDPDDTGGAAWGCQVGDCRRLRAAAFGL